MSHFEGGPAIRPIPWHKGGRLFGEAATDTSETPAELPHHSVTSPYGDMLARQANEGIGPAAQQPIEAESAPQPEGPQDAS